MEPTPLLGKASSYGLLPRLWLLALYRFITKAKNFSNFSKRKWCWLILSFTRPQAIEHEYQSKFKTNSALWDNVHANNS